MEQGNDDSNLSRRLLLGGGAAAIGVGLAGVGSTTATASPSLHGGKSGSRAAVRAAVSFL